MEGQAYPEITYGCEMPERLHGEKMEKKMKKVMKEGGKRGVEIEGAADMGGLQFFCTSMDEPNGDVDLLYESMRAMNARSDPSEEERKGGSGRIGKMIISKNQEDTKLAMVAYCPPAKQDTLVADAWMKDILAELGGGDLLFGDATTAKALINNDPDKGLFVLKLKDSAISSSINYLKKKGLFPDGNDDDDDDYVFGDDDFPSADAVEETPVAEEQADGEVDDPLAMLGGMGGEELYKVTAVPEDAGKADAEEVAEGMDDPLAMLGGMGGEELYKVTAVTEDTGKPAEEEASTAGSNEEAEAYPTIKYGCEVPLRLTDPKMEKKMKKVIKEGGKRGVEIEGAADMGGLQFFCTSMEEPNGDVDLLYESMKSMNAKSEPSEEERKGGSGRIGKMIISKDQEDTKLAMVAYCPPSKQGTLTADVWMKDILSELGGGEFVFGDATTAKAVLANDPDKGLFVLKLKDAAITVSINYLKKLALFPDNNDDDDDDYVFGDDDFPSM